MDSIFERRSTRKFTGDLVSEEQVEALVKAAMNAPSAGNSQPWQFIVIKKRELLDQIPEFHPYAKMAKDAPVAIVVCGDPKDAKFGGMFWVQDCAAATQNILLAAEASGLGSVWVGIHPIPELIEKVRALLSLPEHIYPFSLVPIGYKGEEKPANTRFDREKVHYDTW